MSTTNGKSSTLNQKKLTIWLRGRKSRYQVESIIEAGNLTALSLPWVFLWFRQLLTSPQQMLPRPKRLCLRKLSPEWSWGKEEARLWCENIQLSSLLPIKNYCVEGVWFSKNHDARFTKKMGFNFNFLFGKFSRLLPRVIRQ